MVQGTHSGKWVLSTAKQVGDASDKANSFVTGNRKFNEYLKVNAAMRNFDHEAYRGREPGANTNGFVMCSPDVATLLNSTSLSLRLDLLLGEVCLPENPSFEEVVFSDRELTRSTLDYATNLARKDQAVRAALQRLEELFNDPVEAFSSEKGVGSIAGGTTFPLLEAPALVLFARY